MPVLTALPQAGSKFVFVPGPLDPGAAEILPRPPLPAYFTEKLAEEMPSAVFTTNPCRVRTHDNRCRRSPPTAGFALSPRCQGVTLQHGLSVTLLRWCRYDTAQRSW